MSPIDLPSEIADALVDPHADADFDRLHATYTWARTHNPLARAVTASTPRTATSHRMR